MRVLHTSDWHLGQHFMGKSREAEHQAFLDWLLETIRAEQADALVVAGDIYDTGTPPSYARAMFNRFIVSLRETGCPAAVFVGGNHDSAATLNEGKELLACLDTHVVGRVTEDLSDHVLALTHRDGTPGAILCAVPFIRPRDVMGSRGDETARDKQLALAEAISKVYHRVFEAARNRQAAVADTKPLPILATGHLTLLGGRSGESVRDIYIGSLDALNPDLLPDFDYVALGHLHRGQTIAGRDHIRYAGSPIPLSFDEGPKTKQVLRVDCRPGSPPSVTSLPVPCFRRLLTLSGSLEEIESRIPDLPGPVDDRTSWLEVEVDRDSFLPDLTARVQAMIDGSPLELLRVRRRRQAPEPGRDHQAPETLAELSAEEVFQRRLALEEMDKRDQARLMGLFRQVAGDIRDGEAP